MPSIIEQPVDTVPIVTTNRPVVAIMDVFGPSLQGHKAPSTTMDGHSFLIYWEEQPQSHFLPCGYEHRQTETSKGESEKEADDLYV